MAKVTYSKIHKNEKNADYHATKIKDRGGKAIKKKVKEGWKIKADYSKLIN